MTLKSNDSGQKNSVSESGLEDRLEIASKDIQKVDKLKLITNFREKMVELEHKPKTKFLIQGVKEGSMGFVFGPPKSGKTVFLESLLQNLSVGRNAFMGFELEPVPKKCLFISLEEGGKDYRYERNVNQFGLFNEEEKELIFENFIASDHGLPQFITGASDWDLLEEAILESEAKIVVIDSLNRLTSDSNADEQIAKLTSQKLRELAENCNVTLFVINHVPKEKINQELHQNSMSGSRIYASEADFLIGINRTANNSRYSKLIVSRYDKDDIETVNKFEINDSQSVHFLGKVVEKSLFMDIDGRYDNKNETLIFDEMKRICAEREVAQIQTAELSHLFGDDENKMSRVTFHASISKLKKRGVISQSNKGIYTLSKMD